MWPSTPSGNVTSVRLNVLFAAFALFCDKIEILPVIMGYILSLGPVVQSPIKLILG